MPGAGATGRPHLSADRIQGRHAAAHHDRYQLIMTGIMRDRYLAHHDRYHEGYSAHHDRYLGSS
jgi:hypothetical protein